MLDASLFLSPAEQAQAFLSALFAPTDLILCRPIEVWTDPTSGKKESRTIYQHTRHVIAGMCGASLAHLERVAVSDRANLFFGVCPRVGSGGGFDQAWQIRMVRALWADVDGVSPAEVLVRCAAAKPAPIPAPSIVVGSGNGAHLYWLLDQPYLITDGLAYPSAPAVLTEWTEKEGKKLPRRYFKHPVTNQQTDVGRGRMGPQLSSRAQHLQDIVQGLSAAIGGDHTHDLARILRIPGTLNRKDERNGRPPVLAQLLACDPSRRYPLEQFAQLAAASPIAQKREGAAKVPLPVPRSMTSSKRDKLNQLVAISALAAPGTRSEKDFDLCCYAIKAAVSPSEVWLMVANVGKFAEKGRGYFDDTWRAAADEVKSKEYERLNWRANGKAGASGHALPSVLFNLPAPAPADQPAPPDQPTLPSGPAPKIADDDPHRLAELYLARHAAHVDGPTLRFWREDWWRWTGRAYVAVPEADIRATLTQSIKEEFDRLNVALQESKSASYEDGNETSEKVTQSLLGNVLNAMRSLCLVSSDCEQPVFLPALLPVPLPALNHTLQEAKKKPIDLIAMENGLLDLRRLLKDLEAGVDADHSAYLIPHTPRWFSPICLPYAFDPTVECPTWQAFLEKNLEADGERIELLQEWAGYILTPDTSMQKFFCLEGDGGNGKSVVCAVLRAVVGNANVSHVPVEQFGERFSLASTIGKLANIPAEVGEVDRIAEGRLKEFTSGDRMTLDRKNRDPIEVKPSARLTVSWNTRPRFSDRSGGLWRRMMILPMTRPIEEHEKIRGMDDETWWDEIGELPGIFTWALSGLLRVRRNRRFTVPQLSRAAVEEYRVETNPARDFLIQNYEPCDVEFYLSTAEVYGDYKSYCEVNGAKPLGNIQFGKEVKRLFPASEKKRMGNKGERFWAYPGIAKKSD